MEWPVVKERLVAAATKLRSNKGLDLAVEEILGQIPIVGGFASKYWSSIGGSDAAKASELARFLEELSQQEASFRATEHLLEEQSDLLLGSQRSLDLILLQVKGVNVEIGELKAEVRSLGSQMGEIVAAAKKRFVGDALRVSATLVDDHKRQEHLVAVIKKAIADAGDEVTADGLYDLAMLFMASNRIELAEACLLEVHQLDPDREQALAALGQLYQRRAHEYILQKNFGFAEDVLDKALAYAKAAQDHTDSGVDLRLGYIYKELGQGYALSNQRPQAVNALKAARKLFAGVLAVDQDNPSAWNGMGSVDIVEGKYEAAVQNISKAVALNRDYVEAWYDLAQTYMALSRNTMQEKTSLEHLLKGFEAYIRVKELAMDGVLLPPHAEQHLDRMYEPVAARFKPEAGGRQE